MTLFLPTVYQTLRIYFIGDMPNDDSINIASQLAWVSLFYEVIQEALILPLFFILGRSIQNNSIDSPKTNLINNEFQNKVRTGLILCTSTYLVLSIVIIIFAHPLVQFMSQDSVLIKQSVDYIRLETIAAIFSTIAKFLVLVFLTLNKDKSLYILLGLQMILSVVLDTFLISSLEFSARLGVNGIAIVNIIVNISIVILAIILLHKQGVLIFKKSKLSFAWQKEWFKIGLSSGLESFIRNLAFMIMIIKMVNIILEQGNYWVANNFIFGWLLLPSFALADLIKQEIGTNQDNISKKTFGYLLLTTIFGVFWIASIPLWQPFIQYVLNIDSYKAVFNIVLMQTGFYIVYLFNNVFDSTFYGVGKTNYMLIQSIIINVGYYGTMFILYLTKVFVPTLASISIMFGLGLVLDFIPTMIIYIYMLKKNHIHIQFNFNTINSLKSSRYQINNNISTKINS